MRHSSRIVFGVTASIWFAMASAGSLYAQQPGQNLPKTGQQDPSSTQSDTKPGESLAKRLDRTDGVIKPPSDVDPGINARVPDPNPNTTPVIPPPGTNGDRRIQPK